MPLRLTEAGGGVTVDLIVKPRASRIAVGPVEGDRLRVAVTAPPVDGEANAAVIAALAEALGVPRRAITLVAGQTGKRKTVRIEGIAAAAIRAIAEP